MDMIRGYDIEMYADMWEEQQRVLQELSENVEDS